MKEFLNKTLGFFAREEGDIRRGRFLSVDEKLLPQYNEIWYFSLVDKDHVDFHYVKIVCVAYDNDLHFDAMSEKLIVFNRCDEKGLFISLRTGEGDNEKIIKQPFYLNDRSFIFRYKKL